MSPWQIPRQVPTSQVAGRHTTHTPNQNPFLKPKDRTCIADLLQDRVLRFEESSRAKWEKMTRMHSSEWFKQSSNKELDERGSRASVLVEGLRRPNEDIARTDLKGMTEVARDYFHALHKPEDDSDKRNVAQAMLLEEVRQQSLARPNPADDDVLDGPFSEEEMRALLSKMPNTVPGPDGIPYDFWKKLACTLDKLQEGDTPPMPFWEAFGSLTRDIAARGSSRAGFKNANISLFYKKGDPTLVSNYRPISSMNTDCKMYTNLINSRLAPWAVAKLHPDQKGFVPGRLMSEHTRLASEVAHLCDATGTPGFIVGLDQAKAYDCVDQQWLLRVLTAFGLPPGLTLLISDITNGCKSQVRINSRYSQYITLKRGVRQGDPLSCLLFNFSIEPLAIRLRDKVVGLTILRLWPVKVMLYADDINLYLGSEDSIPEISRCLEDTSRIIGSKFNMDKTDVKPVGPHDFQLACYENQDMAGSTIPGAHILPPTDPLRILGVWIGSRDHARQRWQQIDKHIRKIIAQWRAIGASAQNRALLAKALMLSRCHFLLDSNGIPPAMLRKTSNRIMSFVWGKFSAVAYHTLEAPYMEGGLNTPSLVSRKHAIDLKFLSDLATGDQRMPWKQWVWMDLKMASATSRKGVYSGLNPFVQQAYTMPSLLQDRLSQAFMTARHFGLDPTCAAPSMVARMKAPLIGHPALPKAGSQRFLKLKQLSKQGVKRVGQLYQPPALRGMGLSKTVTSMKAVVHETNWSPHIRNNGCLVDPSVNVWPNMDGPLGCVRVFTAPRSIVAGRVVKDAYKATRVRVAVDDYKPASRPVMRVPDEIVYEWDIHVWTDGSAKDNRKDTCSAGSAWVSDLQFSDKVSLTGVTLSNNVAEVAAVVLCLSAWRDAHIVIHTDSTFVLGLTKGGLLAMERDGWGDALRHLSRGPPTPLLKALLHLLRDRTGRVSFMKTKAHDKDVMNNLADQLANEGRCSGRVLDIGSLRVPDGWVDEAPVLCHQPLDYLTRLVVRDHVPAPTLTLKFGAFSDRWTVMIGWMFGVTLDPGNYVGKVWSLAIPEGLKEVLWKEMTGAQVLGHRYYSTHTAKSDMGRVCPCGVEMSLNHILVGCPSYDLAPLKDILEDVLRSILPWHSFKTLHPDEWGIYPWYPLIALKAIEEAAFPIVKGRKELLKGLQCGRQQREWVIGNYFWALWKWCMKDIHDTKFKFVPGICGDILRDTLMMPVPAHLQPVGENEGTGIRADADRTRAKAPRQTGDLSRLPPPVSHILQHKAVPRLSARGKSILRALKAHSRLRDPHPITSWERILHALTDDAYS